MQFLKIGANYKQFKYIKIMKTKFKHLKTITKLDNLHLNYYNGGYILVFIGENESERNAFGMNKRLTNKEMSIFINGLLEMYYFLNK